MTDAVPADHCPSMARRLIELLERALAAIEETTAEHHGEHLGDDIKMMTGFAKLLETLWGLEQRMTASDEGTPDVEHARAALLARVQRLVPNLQCDETLPGGASAR